MMDITTLQTVLGWCTLINYLLLTCWFLMFIGCRSWIYQIHSRWFHISENAFDLVHYCGMGIWKMLWFFFNFLPWAVLSLL